MIDVDAAVDVVVTGRRAGSRAGHEVVDAAAVVPSCLAPLLVVVAGVAALATAPSWRCRCPDVARPAARGLEVVGQTVVPAAWPQYCACLPITR